MLKGFKRKIAVIMCIAMIVPNNLSNFSFVFADGISEGALSTRSSVVSIGTDSDIDVFNLDEELVEEDGSNINYEEEPEEDVAEDSMTVESELDEEPEDVEVTTPSEVDDEMESIDESEVVEKVEKRENTEEETIASYSEIDLDVATISEVIEESNSKFFGVENIASDSEIAHGMGYISPNVEVPIVKKNNSNIPLFGDGALPTSYDAREHSTGGMSWVSPIRNQGQYGVCWAFSTIGMIETSIRKKGLVSSETDSNLSEAALAYYYYNLKDIYNPGNIHYVAKPAVSGKDYNTCSGAIWSQRGGSQMNATLFMSRYVGAVKEDENSKYEKMGNIETNGLDWDYAFNKNSFVVNNVQFINKNDRDAIKKAIMANGSVGMSYYEAGGGYRNQVGDEYYHMFAKSNASNPFCKANHAVMIVGWDDNIPAENFNSLGNNETLPDFNGGWLVRNSWGGDDVDPMHLSHMKDGYFWMSYDERTMDGTLYSVDAIKADTYKYNYHYDGSGATFTDGVPINSTGKVGHIFKVTGDENQILDAINVAVASGNSRFKVKVYTKETAMSNPEDGTLMNGTGEEVNTDTIGIHTIPLTTKVSLPLDTYFSIVIEPISSDDGDKVSFYLDMTVSGGGVNFYNEQKPGQTFQAYYASNWNDDYTGDFGDYLLRIKAFTNPATGIGFNANGGEGSMSRIDAGPGDTVTLTANAFTREGYTFDKWNTEANGSGTDYADEASITLGDSAITLYAQWTPIHYNLKLNPNGQTGTETSVSYAYDEEVNLANPSFTSTDYTFGGWQTSSGNAEKVYDEGQTGVKGLASTEGADYTLYAHWLPGAYKVRFNANGGDGTMSLQNITIDESTALTANAFTKTGYTFANWNTEVNGGGTTYTNGQSVLNLAGKDDTFDLYAQWAPITYTIVYNTNGGSITPTSKIKTYGTNLTLDTPTKDGYTFAGWFSNEALSASYNGSTDICTTQGQSVSIYAKWNANTYTIQFDVGGHATAPANLTKIYGQNVTLPEPISPESGYLFVGWYKEESLTNVYTGNEDLSSTQGDTKTVYAKWKQQIIFNANGHGTNPPSMDVTTSTITLPNITCAGYIFGGWYEEAGCTTFAGNAGATYTVTGPKTLYAKWTAITYNIKYNNITGSSLEGSDTITKTYGTNVSLGSPTKTGYIFDSWYSNAGLTISYDGTTDLTTVDGSTVNIYAKWTAITYTITYNTAGHATAPLNTTKIYETNYSVPNPTNVVEGYTFLGWFSDNALTIPYDGTTDLTTTQGDMKTLYSKWKAKLTFVANGQGVAPGSVDVVIGESTTLPTITGVTGYTFGGWYNEAACSSLVGNGGASYTVNEVKTLYAKWTLMAGYVEAKYETNGGSSINSQAVLSGGIFTRPGNPSKSGFTFDNWYRESELVNIYDFSSVATQSIILYAKWNQVVNNNSNRRSRGGSSSGGGGGSGVHVGPLAKELEKNSLTKQENAKQVSSRSVDIVVSLTNINWQVDPVSGKVKLGLDKNNPSIVAANGFFAIPSMDANGNAKNDIYNFDAEGNMVTGWAKDAEGKMYFFETDEGINIGKMLSNSWKEIGTGQWYYFAADGKMMTNGVTPDGYTVGSNGLWQ